MAKQLNVALNFTAETGQAKAAIQELQQSLSKIAYAGTSGNIVGNSTQQIKEASEAAKQLQYHLNNAYNATTGNFDLSRLDKSLQTSKTNIADLSAKLLGAGAAGQQAFAQLAQSISMADQPMFRVNAKLTEMLTTLKNTARWQISSSILHGFMGTIQHAYGYAQDLNESLNNIRIVTGQSVDQMAKFAEQANKSAKALSTTTTEYTNASLIYYQQGLSDAEVQERTDVTIKMANVAGVSAQTVSDQMTAVWNNFDDGSKSLEYYADVMTALGAATASSTDEIAAGLEKFAAVSETVGLSYEYATAALATVTATTRQSADVVGNAFKTLFARIQGLNLGETLDDGTTLNKYSQALEKVGISIFEQNGQMKEMDDILDEMGAKWDTLDKAQQTALAQTVAGVRQYTQLVALMDKWDYFKENLGIAYGAEGELDKQAEIYAESWEAARDRVSAAAEDIYNDLLDDKFFITINNGFANLLTGVGEFVEGIGGAKGVITAFGSIFLTNFAHKMPQAIQNLQYNLKVLTKGSKEAYQQIQTDMQQVTQKFFTGEFGKTVSKDSSLGFMITSSNSLAVARTRLAEISNQMTSSEKQLAEMELSLAQSIQQETLALKQKNEERLKTIELESRSILSEQALTDLSTMSYQPKNLDFSAVREEIARAIASGMSEGALQGQSKFTISLTQALIPLKAEMDTVMSSSLNFEDKKNALISLLQVIPETTRATLGLKDSFAKLQEVQTPDQLKEIFKNINLDIQLTDKGANELITIFKSLFNGSSGDALAKNLRSVVTGLKDGTTAAKEFEAIINGFSPTHFVSGVQAMTSMAAGLGNIAMLGNSINTIFQNLSNPDLSGWQKFSSILTAISFGVPMVNSLLKNLGVTQEWLTGILTKQIAAQTAATVAREADLAAQKLQNELTLAGTILGERQTMSYSKQTAAEMANTIAGKAGIETKKIKLILDKLLIANDGKRVILTKEKIAAIIAEATAETGANAVRGTAITLQTILNALTGQYGKLLMAIGWVAILGAVIGIVKGLDALVVTQKEANKSIDEANQKYDEENQKLQDLESQLQSVQDRIKELQALGTLSITEQEELNNLKEQEASLQRQIAMQEELTKAAQRNQANEIVKNWGKSQRLTTEGQITKATGEYAPFGEAIYETLNQYKARIGFEDTEEWARKNAETYQKILEWQKEIDDNHAKWLEENKEQIQANEDNYSSYMEAVKAETVARDDEKIAEMQGDLKDQRQKIYGDNYDEKVLSPLINELSRTFAGDFKADGSTDWSKKVSEEDLDAAGVSGADFDAYMDEMVKTALESSDKVTSEELAKLSLDELAILFNNIEALKGFEGDNLIDFINGVKNEINSFNLSSWKNEFNQTKEIIDGLETGDSISAEDYNLLSDEYKQYFTVQSDGTAILIGKAEELKALIEGIQVKDLKDSITSKQEDIYEIAGAAGYVGEDGTYKGVAFDNYLSWAEQWGTAERQGSLSEGGLNTEEIAFIEKVNELYQIQANTLQEAAAAVREHQEALDSEQNSLAQTASTMNQLESYQKAGLISKEEYEQNKEATFIKDVEGQGFDYSEIEEYADIIDDMVETSEELDDRLDDNRESLLNFAKSAKQTERGIKKLNDGLEDWKEALSSKDALKSAKAWDQLEDALMDVMNVTDELSEAGMKLGDHFKNYVLENMEEVEKAAQGDRKAIMALQKVAAEDMIIQLDLPDDVEANALSQISSIMDQMQSMLDSQDLQVGTPIMETGPLLAQLNSLINSLGVGVNQAQAILAGLGFDAEVEEVPVQNTVSRHFEGVSAKPGYMGYPEQVPWSVDTQDTVSGEIGSALRIKSGQYVGGGNVSGGSGGGGSKGGGGSSKQPKYAEKKNDSDKERYHTLINQLEDLSSEYDSLSEAKDRAFGTDKLNAIDDEIAKTDELIAKQEEYLAAISADLPVDKSIMEAYYNDVIGGPAIQFDEKGNISNFDEIQDAMYAKYNAMTAYDEDSEQWKVFEKKYEQLEKYIEQYEETYDLLRDEETAYQELLNQRLDLMLEQVQYEVELKLNVSDDSLKLIEFQLDMLEDNAFKAAEAIEFQAEQAEILYDKMQASEQGLKDILATSDMSVNEIEQLLAGNTDVLQGHTFTEAQIEAIKEYRDNLLDFAEELQEVREEVQERLLDAFDQWNEELDEGIEKFDHYNSLMENYKNIIDIVGKDYLKVNNSMLGDLSQAMVENNINRVYATRDALKALTETEIQARQAYEEALARGNENDILYWEETLKTIGDEVSDAQEEMMQAWEDALQAAAEAFEAAVESAIENFEKALLPFGTLEEFSDAYEKQKELADQYLDDYQQIYELSKLNRDIANSIDDTKSIAGKQKLKGLMDDINKLQEEGTQLSEYDLEYLQKTYDLRMAEIALEEAQKAKDTVRLTRDNEGNWSYAYTTNTDAADDAAQKYEDALYAMQDLSSEYIDEMSEQLISTSQEMEEALAAVRVEDYASIEEYYKKLDEIQQYYLDRMGYMQGEMQKALDNNKALYEQDWQNYSNATGYKISDDEKFAMSYKDTVLGTLFDSESDIVDFQQRVNEALGTNDSGLIGELLDAYLQWSENTDNAMIAAGTSSEGFADDMDQAVHGDGGIVDSSTAATDAVNDMANQMVAGFDTITNAVVRWQSQVGDAADAVINDYLNTVEAFNLMVATLSSTKGNSSAENNLTDIVTARRKSDTDIASMDTGGYTGAWGPEGKFLLAHEKELILNPDDTKNFLSAIHLTREMLNTIDINARQASIGFGTLSAGFIKEESNNTLEQQVHITAEFPNVTDHYEVEEALNNLINTSSQYANRK